MIAFQEQQQVQGTNQMKVLFICKNNTSKSFYLELSQEEFSTLTLEAIQQRALKKFSENNKHYEIINNMIQPFTLINESKDILLVDSPQRFLPFYFEESEKYFDINVDYQGKVYSILLELYSSPSVLTELVGPLIGIQKERLLLKRGNEVLISNLLSKTETLKVCTRDIQIKIDGLIYFIDSKLTIKQQLELISNDKKEKQLLIQRLYRNQQLLDENATFESLNVKDNDVFTSFINVHITIVDLQGQSIQKEFPNNIQIQQMHSILSQIYGINQFFLSDSYSFLQDNQTLKMLQKGTFYIKTLTGQSVAVQLTPSDKLSSIQEQIQKLQGIPPDQQRLIINGVDQQDMNIQAVDVLFASESKIFMVLRLRGGGCTYQQFVDIENSKSREFVQFSTDAPEYRCVTSGINIEGYCRNKDCKYKNKLVISPIGFGSIEIVQDKNKKINCPNSLCDQQLELVTCGFTNCRYFFTGLKQEQNGGLKHVITDITQQSEQDYVHYNPINPSGSSNMVLWKQLFIIALPIPPNGMDDYNLCLLCYQYVTDDRDVDHLDCCSRQNQHYSHRSCKQDLAIPIDCPLCKTIQ